MKEKQRIHVTGSFSCPCCGLQKHLRRSLGWPSIACRPDSPQHSRHLMGALGYCGSSSTTVVTLCPRAAVVSSSTDQLCGGAPGLEAKAWVGRGLILCKTHKQVPGLPAFAATRERPATSLVPCPDHAQRWAPGPSLLVGYTHLLLPRTVRSGLCWVLPCLVFMSAPSFATSCSLCRFVHHPSFQNRLLPEFQNKG